jgi:hypothetical protein
VFFNTVSAFLACSTAGFLNALAMRYSELGRGIDVFDPENVNDVAGKSKIAAKHAVLQTAISRYLLTVTIFLPSMLLWGLEKGRMIPKNHIGKTTLECSLFFIELYLAVPIAIAAYPQFALIKTSELEPEIQEWRNQQGK